MDDFVCFFNDKQELKNKFKLIKEFIYNILSLELNEEQINNCKCGIPFLGYRVFFDNIRLSLKSKRRFARKIKKFNKLYTDGKISDTEYLLHVEPLVSFIKKSNCNSFIKNYLINL